MLLKLIKDLYFTNILGAPDLCVKFVYEIFWRKNIGEKPVRKMLAKLNALRTIWKGRTASRRNILSGTPTYGRETSLSFVVIVVKRRRTYVHARCCKSVSHWESCKAENSSFIAITNKLKKTFLKTKQKCFWKKMDLLKKKAPHRSFAGMEVAVTEPLDADEDHLRPILFPLTHPSRQTSGTGMAANRLTRKRRNRIFCL